jgi:hypothetical protein
MLMETSLILRVGWWDKLTATQLSGATHGI